MKKLRAVSAFLAVSVASLTGATSNAQSLPPHPASCGSDHCASIPSPSCSKTWNFTPLCTHQAYAMGPDKSVLCCGTCGSENMSHYHNESYYDVFYYTNCDGLGYVYQSCDFQASMTSTGVVCGPG